MEKNIILIVVDDGNAYARYRDALGEPLQLPNLDRIEAASTAFTSAYCQAPICGPSRNSLMSGLSPHQTGILDNYTHLFDVLRPEQLWQFKLKQKGYYCSTAGKVHHSFAPLARPVHDVLYSHPPHGLKLGPPRGVPVKRYGGITGGGGTTDPKHDKLYYDYQSAEDAVAFLESYDGTTPFYREIGFHHPHIPLKTPAAFKDLYDEQGFEQPKDWEKGFGTTDYPNRFMVENMDLRDRDHWRKSVRNYFSAYTHVDEQIGRVWDALKASRHADNTILIFTSDHGHHLGDKGRMRKFSLWEESCCVPLLIHDPDVPPQQISDPVALLDVGPTILDYAGCAPLGGAPGVSLRQMIHGASEPDRAVPTFLFGNSSMRKGRYRITLYQNGEGEFHDVEDDPWLTRNLAGIHPDYGIWREELAHVCAAHGLCLPEGPQTAAPFHVSFFGSNSPHKAGSRGAVGNLDMQSPCFTPPAPGAGVHFTTLDHCADAPLPNGFRRMHYGADAGGGVKSFRAYGNQQNNEFSFPGSVNRFHLSIHPGPGQTRIGTQNDDLVVYCCEGETDIIAGNSNCVLYGGTGLTSMRSGRGAARMIGGAGHTTMVAGSGPVEIVSGAGHNTINGGEGPADITLSAGQSTVVLQGDTLTLRILRTGLPQVITGFKSGYVDLCDWAAMGPAHIAKDGGNAVISCTTERVVFVGTDPLALRAAVHGVDLI